LRLVAQADGAVRVGLGCCMQRHARDEQGDREAAEQRGLVQEGSPVIFPPGGWRRRTPMAVAATPECGWWVFVKFKSTFQIPGDKLKARDTNIASRNTRQADPGRTDPTGARSAATPRALCRRPSTTSHRRWHTREALQRQAGRGGRGTHPRLERAAAHRCVPGGDAPLHAGTARGRSDAALHAAGRELRERHDVLMDGDGPAGDRWNYDSESRKARGAFRPRGPCAGQPRARCSNSCASALATAPARRRTRGARTFHRRAPAALRPPAGRAVARRALALPRPRLGHAPSLAAGPARGGAGG